MGQTSRRVILASFVSLLIGWFIFGQFVVPKIISNEYRGHDLHDHTDYREIRGHKHHATITQIQQKASHSDLLSRERHSNHMATHRATRT